MDLVLNDIANWRDQLVTELKNLEQQEARLKESKEMAQKKIDEATELLGTLEFDEEAWAAKKVEATSAAATPPAASQIITPDAASG
jgi:hypothetical protein